MPATYENIATITADGSSAYATFSAVPSTYTDLVLVCQFRSSTSGAYTDSYLRLATGGGSVDTGSNYSSVRIYGSGSGAAATSYTSTSLIYGTLCPAASTTAGVLSTTIFHINNYSNSTTHKTVIVKGGDSATYLQMGVGTWRNTGAITTVQFLTNSSFTSGSTFTLYGIKAA